MILIIAYLYRYGYSIDTYVIFPTGVQYLLLNHLKASPRAIRLYPCTFVPATYPDPCAMTTFPPHSAYDASPRGRNSQTRYGRSDPELKTANRGTYAPSTVPIPNTRANDRARTNPPSNELSRLRYSAQKVPTSYMFGTSTLVLMNYRGMLILQHASDPAPSTNESKSFKNHAHGDCDSHPTLQ